VRRAGRRLFFAVDQRRVLHLAAVTGWSLRELMDMDAAELARWCREAVEYHNELNKIE